MKVASLPATMPNSASLTQTLWSFSFLQLLDFLTTVAFLVNGVGEANPLVRALMFCAPNPLLGLALVKVAAVILAVGCWRAGRFQIVDRMNLFFALVVTWNLTALIVATAHR
ncbi:MAG: DUF5658 family protein [Bryobacteraceae bacterium]|nr:DUF5658 family protein [Bryobacteraceae bacterium]